MKKITNNFFKSTAILVLSGFVTKALGLLIKIIYTRIVGTKTIALYTLVMPTYSLLITITSFAMPTTIAKMIGEKDDIKILNSATIIIIIINLLIIFLMFLLSPYIATYLLKEKDAYYLLIAMAFTLPFASIACILKGYYYGKNKMYPHVISNLVEQIIRIVLVITIIPFLMKRSYVLAAAGLILTSFFTELASIIVFILFLNKKDKINVCKIRYNPTYGKEIYNISMPFVSSRIIANVSYFLEPIVITNVLLYLGYSRNYILIEYGVFNAYAIATLTIPSFFISAICMVLIPEISKNFKTNKKRAIKRFNESIIYSLIIGIFFTSIIFIFRNDLLNILYGTTKGINYIKYLAPFFILFYLEAIFTSFMQGIGKTKTTLFITIISSITKLCNIIFISLFKIGIYSLLISEIIDIILIVILNIYFIKKYIKR